VREYKRLGGEYEGERSESEGIRRWYRERWVDMNRPRGKDGGYYPCGRESIKKGGKYPLCRPSRRVTKETPRTYKEITSKSIRRARREKKGSGRIKFGE
jgi:hypothetical protein